MIKKHIPNALTTGNVLSGTVGIIFCFQGDLVMAAALMLLGAIFDFFDGFAARLLKVASPIGKELDSLADMVSFGVLPGMIAYHLLLKEAPHPYFPYVALLIPAFSALRLAKFNVDTRQSDRFIGVPTPANALLFGSLPVIAEVNPAYAPLVYNPWLLAGVAIVMSFLLVSELPLIAMKFKTFGWKKNEFRFVLLGLSCVFIVLFKVLAIPMIVITYILLSIMETIVHKDSKEKQ
ncbi:CDP-diacylglycerol--serine O-phosphatidyltransferase [Algivirga pacifica]|uniref:CDP-diacylglycerol--serine O-phosphatidyltransferase n=1 Tax=Algivirga pacifica TaxID=1162670 RepID=A0ABP9DDE0_9BACT